MITKFLPLLIIVLVSFQSYAKEKEADSSNPHITEIIEVIGDVAQSRSVQSVSVIDKGKMRKFRLNNLKSFISTTPGVLTLSSGKFGQASSTYIRGSNSTQILYLIDGIKVRDVSNIGGVSLATISPFLVNKIEIVRGPLSSLYGSDAMGGVISINSRTDSGIRFETSLGSHGSYLGNVSWAKEIEGFNISFASANQLYSDNIRNDKFKNNGFTARIDYKKNERFKTGFRFFGNITDSGIPFNISMPSLHRKYRQFNYVAAIPFEFEFNNTTRLKINLSYNRNNYKFEDEEDLWNPYFKNTSDNKEVEAVFKTRLLNKLFFSGGVDYSSQKIFTENNSGITIDNVRSDYFSSYMLLNFELGDLYLTGSVRYDKYKNVDSNISPQIGFSYLFSDNIKLRGSYSNSFKAPLPVHQINPWGASNFDLKPESGKSFEIGLDLFSKRIAAGITYFSTEYSNLIDWVTIDFTTWTGQYQNISSADIKGVELEFSYSPLNSLILNLTHTYLNTENLSTGNPLPRRPENTTAFSFTYTGKRFSLAGQFRYVGSRIDFDYSNFPPQIENPPFNTYDITTTLPINKSLSLFFKMTNLLNKEYQEFFGYTAPGRRLEAGITYNN